MDEAGTDLNRTRRRWLPHETGRARLVWSVGVVYFAVIWKYMMIAADVVPFPTVHAPAEVAAMVWTTLPGALWPEWHPGLTVWYYREILPYVALGLWPFCLAPWKRRGARVLVAVAMLVAVAWVLWRASFLFLPPLGLFFAGMFLFTPFVPSDGEGYTDVSLIGGVSCWVLMMLVIIGGNFAMRWADRRVDGGVCGRCGYSRARLKAAACPECGAALKSNARGGN